MPFAIALRSGFLFACVLLLAAQAAPPPGYQMVFHDEFDSLNLDTKGDNASLPWTDMGLIWQLGKGRGFWANASYIGSGALPLGVALEEITPQGTLMFNACPTPCNRLTNVNGAPFVAGMITTAKPKPNSNKSRLFYRGYFEIRARFPMQNGMHPCFGMYSPKNWPPEIQMVEEYGLHDRITAGAAGIDHGCFHGYEMYAGDSLSTALGLTVTPEDWHTYGLLWTADSFHYSYDGAVTCSAEATPACYPDSMFVTGGMQLDPMEDSTTHFPMQMELDYFRHYQKQ
jgi:beta-glucanase (GH16 family)